MALRLCLERIAPPRRDAPVAISLPELKCSGDTLAAINRIVQTVACGEINVGLGMWTHEFQLAGTYYLGEQRGTALSIGGTYEIHHNKKDVDIRPGSHFSLNYGVSQFLPVTETVLGELSIFGTGQWQVTEDRGSDATNKEVKDQVYGLGLQGSLTYLPWGANLSFH